MSFYSWYSWPNVVLSLFGGFLMDRVFGIRLGAVIFACFVFAGQVELNIILEREEMLGLKERWGNSSFA